MPSPRPLVLQAGELAVAVGGWLAAGDARARVAGFVIDSRRVAAGDLFVAIRGTRLDGHRFVAEAVRRGAAGVVVSDASAAERGTEAPFVIVVPDTTRALQGLATFVRRRSRARVVAITGSVGKTTTKELVAALLAGRYRVFRNEGNLNNHIGLPLSLLELRHDPQVAVVELGMNHAGEIRALVAIAEPDIRVWTNVAEVHSAFFESIEGIADAKAEIMDGATPRSQLVANAGDARVMARTAAFPGRVTTFGVETDADVQATAVEARGLRGMAATLRTPAGSLPVRTPLLGYGQIANVTAAVAVAQLFPVPLAELAERVAACPAQPRRGQVVERGDVTIVDDTYNSSPAALQAALDAVGRETGYARRVAILGEMLELGERANALHEACGRAAADAGFDIVVAVGGEAAQALADGARAGGLPATAVSTVPTGDETAELAPAIVRDGDLVLVKGSRGIGLDRVVDRLRGQR